MDMNFSGSVNLNLLSIGMGKHLNVKIIYAVLELHMGFQKHRFQEKYVINLFAF